jgi:hypothetical protein
VLAQPHALAPGAVAVAVGPVLPARPQARRLRGHARLVHTEDDGLFERQHHVEQTEPGVESRRRAASFERRGARGDEPDVARQRRVQNPQPPRLHGGERAGRGQSHRGEERVEMEQPRGREAHAAQHGQRAADPRQRAPRAAALDGEARPRRRGRNEQRGRPPLRRHRGARPLAEHEGRAERVEEPRAPQRQHEEGDGERYRQRDEA